MNNVPELDRVLRGGSWYDLPSYCRPAFRFRGYPVGRFNYFGFRVVRTPRSLLREKNTKRIQCIGKGESMNNVPELDRVLRGGSWFFNPWVCRSAFRLGNVPDYRNFNFGFRVVRTSSILPREGKRIKRIQWLDEERYKKYEKEEGEICPFCGAPHTSLDFGEIEVDKNQVFQEAKCLDCMKSWLDVYRRAGVEFLVEEPSKGDEP